MILPLALVLLFALAATLIPNATDDEVPLMEHWKYDPQSRPKILYAKLSKVMADDEAQSGRPCKATSWSLDKFIDRYIGESGAYALYRKPDNWTIQDLLENNDHALFRPYIFEDTFKKYEIDSDEAIERKAIKRDPPERWAFKDFIEKYEAKVVWEQIKDKSLVIGLNDTLDQEFISLIKDLDPTEELLSIEVPRSGRRWWNSQWVIPQEPHEPNLNTTDLMHILYFMRQEIYRTRDRMKVMQRLREMYKMKALYKMGYLFAKTDYACKIFASLAFKFFRACSMIRMSIYRETRLFIHFMDVAYNVERLIDRWFDIDILKDLLVSNDLLARKVILKDENLTSAEMIVEAFDAMFVD